MSWTPHNLLYVLDRFPTLSQTFVENEIVGLRERGFNVTVISLTDGDSPDGALVMRRVRPSKIARDHVALLAHSPLAYVRYVKFAVACRGEGWRPLIAAPSIAAIAKSSDSDHIHSHFAWSASLVARATQILTGLPRSLTLHANDIYVRPRNMHAKAMDAKLVNVCAYNARVMKENFDIDTHAIVHCGVESRETPDATTRKTSPTINLLSVGRLVSKKGFDTLLHALSQLMDAGLDFHCRIVGDGPEAGNLDGLISELQLESRVTLDGAHDNEEVMMMYRHADIFVLACRIAADGDADSQPVVLKEAMAHGLPVVTTSVTGIPEVVDESVGWVVEPSDVNALAEVLAAAMKSEAERKLRGSSAQQRIATHSLRRQVDELLEVMSSS